MHGVSFLPPAQAHPLANLPSIFCTTNLTLSMGSSNSGSFLSSWEHTRIFFFSQKKKNLKWPLSSLPPSCCSVSLLPFIAKLGSYLYLLFPIPSLPFLFEPISIRLSVPRLHSKLLFSTSPMTSMFSDPVVNSHTSCCLISNIWQLMNSGRWS